jgi:hypothetical protein
MIGEDMRIRRLTWTHKSWRIGHLNKYVENKSATHSHAIILDDNSE